MTNQKGVGGIIRGSSIPCRFWNEVNPARRSQLAAAVCTDQLTPDGGSLSLVMTKPPHAAGEYDDGLQRTPELESTAWQVKI